MHDAFTPIINAVADVADKALASEEPHPRIEVGGTAALGPFAVVVFETPEAVSITSQTTSTMALNAPRGLYRLEFTVGAQMWATQKTLSAAGEMVNRWFTEFMRALALDKTLGGTCVNAVPFYGSSGSVSKDRAMLAAINFGVRVTADFNPKR